MTEIKGDKLYVNLGASQTRKRLKGFGHGVRKIESAGRHQAVIIHTATGQHLAELTAQFADVGFSSRHSELDQPIETVRNLGPASAAWLREIGVSTRADLQRLGAVVAYRMVKQRQPRTSLNLLWALAAGLADKDWRDLSASAKQQLRHEAEAD
jgi:hypothetical protein